jgi:hypothetical protein
MQGLMVGKGHNGRRTARSIPYQQCLDFVLVDSASYAPRLVVELDDASHNREDRRERDAFVDDVLAAVGIPIVHVRWRPRFDTCVLAEHIAGRLGIAPSRRSCGHCQAALRQGARFCAHCGIVLAG